jgi:hypothetical protein
MNNLKAIAKPLVAGLVLAAFACGTVLILALLAFTSTTVLAQAKPDTGKAQAESLAKDTAKEKKHGIVLGIGPEGVKVREKNGSFKIKAGDKDINIEIDKNKHFKEGDVYVGVNDTIHDDIAARGNVTVAGVVEGDLAAIGGSVTITGKVEGDVAAIGGPVTLAQGGEVSGDVAAIGGPASISGRVLGDLAAVGGSIEMDSTAVVEGDVATVGGAVTKAPGAQIKGEVTSLDLGLINRFIPRAVGTVRFGHEHPSLGRLAMLGLNLIWFLGLWVLVILVVVFLPKHTEVISESVTGNFFLAGLIGIIAEILILPLFVLLCITVIGIPFALILLPILVLVGFLMGFAAMALVTGKRLVHGLSWKVAGPLGLATLGFLLLIVFFLVGRVIGMPGGVFSVLGWMLIGLGWLISYCALTVGFGAALYTRFGTKPGPWRKNVSAS